MIDLLLGGSPCQGFSFAGKQLNFFDPRSKLFFEYVKVMEILKPKYFLLENVKMKKEYQDVISKHLGVEPIEINSALVSAQNRKRLYWTNIPNITQPEDKNLTVSDKIDCSKQRHIIKINHPETIRETKNYAQYDQMLKGHNSQDQRYFYTYGKVNTITTSRSSIPKIKIGDTVYLCDADDVEIFQTLPHQYTSGLPDGKRCQLIGNGWTVDVIAHILSFIPETYLHTVVSLFDGISCGQIAIEKTGKIYNQYYASEIDMDAIQITQKNYPHTMQLGDVTKIDWMSFNEKISMIQKVS